MKAHEAAAKYRDAKLDERHGRLGALEQALEVKRIELDGKARVLAEDRVAFAKLEVKAHTLLKSLYAAAWKARWSAPRTAPPSCFPSWSAPLKMSPSASAPRLRLRRVSFLLQR